MGFNCYRFNAASSYHYRHPTDTFLQQQMSIFKRFSFRVSVENSILGPLNRTVTYGYSMRHYSKNKHRLIQRFAKGGRENRFNIRPVVRCKMILITYVK